MSGASEGPGRSLESSTPAPAPDKGAAEKKETVVPHGADASGANKKVAPQKTEAEMDTSLVLSPLDNANSSQLRRTMHVLRSAATMRFMVPLLQRYLHHTLNRGMFNETIDPVAMNIPDYYSIIEVSV